MSSTSALEVEELENVPLVRMADIQPDRSVEYVLQTEEKLEYDGTCMLEDYEECIVDDDDSNIGSMVSIKSEEVNCDDAELIVPEVLDDVEIPLEMQPPSPTELPKIPKPSSPDRWPTLEILPGGVINLADKNNHTLQTLMVDRDASDIGDMMYACAKCSQSFKYLFCLVKHVRSHEEEARKEKLEDLTKMSSIERKMADLQRRSSELDQSYIKHKGMADNIEAINKSQVKQKYICLHTDKRKIGPKTKVKRIPKNL